MLLVAMSTTAKVDTDTVGIDQYCTCKLFERVRTQINGIIEHFLRSKHYASSDTLHSCLYAGHMNIAA